MIRVDLRTVVHDVPPQDIITRDNVSVKVNAVVYFRVMIPPPGRRRGRDYHYATASSRRPPCVRCSASRRWTSCSPDARSSTTSSRTILDKQTDPWGIKVSMVELKHVDLPADMQRAMARQAEAEREKRAKIIHAEGEEQALPAAWAAPRPDRQHPVTIQLRYLQTLTEIATEKNSTVLFPVPIEMMALLGQKLAKDVK